MNKVLFSGNLTFLIWVFLSEKCEGNSDLVDTSAASDDTQEAFSMTLPIFQKIEDLSNKLQVYNMAGHF